MAITIIIPLYNAEKTIKKCLNSIFESDFNNKFEVIVVNDGTKDNSLNIVKEFDVKIINQPNKGAAAAKNNGAKNAKTDLIMFLDSDVILYKDTLQKIYNHLIKEDVDYVSVRYSKKPANNKWIHKYKALADYCYTYEFIFTKEQKSKPIKQVVLTGGLEGYKKKVFEELGGFDNKIKGADVEEEKLISKLFKKYHMLSDGNIKTKHHFPNFKSLVKAYYSRTRNSMELIQENDYSQPYLKKNLIRTFLGGLTTIALVISLILFFTLNLIFPFYITGGIFLIFILKHLKMYIIAIKEYNILFALYTLTTGLFFANVICLAGFIGVMKNKLKNEKIS